MWVPTVPSPDPGTVPARCPARVALPERRFWTIMRVWFESIWALTPAFRRGGRLQRVVSNLPTFTEVQRVPLIVLDDELACSPGRLEHVLHKRHSVPLQRRRRAAEASSASK